MSIRMSEALKWIHSALEKGPKVMRGYALEKEYDKNLYLIASLYYKGNIAL